MGMFAQKTTVATQLGVGGANTLDTYLSPEKYRGTEWRVQSEVRRDGAKHDKLTYALTHEAAFTYTHNRALNGHQYSGHYDFSYAIMRHWVLLDDKLSIYAGGMVDALVGFTYNSHNGNNNPAQGYGTLAVGAHLAANYTFSLFNKNITVGYEARYPMLGMMFSPNYGQSYYEIFNRGNYDHNVVFTTFVTAPEWRQMLTLDANLTGKWTLRIGYLGNYQQYKVNQLKQHVYTHRFLIGFTRRFSLIPHRL